jgi:hypothetical protein
MTHPVVEVISGTCHDIVDLIIRVKLPKRQHAFQHITE